MSTTQICRHHHGANNSSISFVLSWRRWVISRHEARCADPGGDEFRSTSDSAKHLDEFVSQHFDFVITLCDRVREVCPEFPAHPDLVHWSIPDPALEGSTVRASYPAFERMASELESRIHFLLAAINEPSMR